MKVVCARAAPIATLVVSLFDNSFHVNIDEPERAAARQCAPTAYAKARNCLMGDSVSPDYAGNCRWWLRTPSFDTDVTLTVDAGGAIKVNGGFSVGGSVVAVRPAIWINAGDLSAA